MTHLIRSIGLPAVVSATAAHSAQAQDNVLELVVVNGPHAGTYRPPVSDCVHYKAQKIYAATWGNLADAASTLAGKATDTKGKANEINEGGINISNPDDPGAKLGELVIAFGSRGEQTKYTASRTPLTLTVKGKGAEITSQGKTKDGIELKVSAQCSVVEQF